MISKSFDAAALRYATGDNKTKKKKQRVRPPSHYQHTNYGGFHVPTDDFEQYKKETKGFEHNRSYD